MTMLQPETQSQKPTKPLTPATQALSDETRPLSYADLRRFLLLVFGLVLMWFVVRELAATLLLFAVVFLLALVLNPLVSKMERRGVRRGLAVMLVMLVLLSLLAFLVWLIVPPILEQINELVKKAPGYWQNISERSAQLTARYKFINSFLPDSEKISEVARGQASKLGPLLLSSTLGIVGAVFGLVISLLLLVFTLSNPRPLVGGLLGLVPDRHREATRRSMARLMEQMTAWAKATLINGVITGVSTGLLLHFIGVQPALVFGVLAFFGEFVPNIGPLVASAPALFVALGIGPEKAGLTLAIILFVQQVESNVLVPFVMGKQMDLHPVTIVFFALAMGSLFGIVGAILAVPAAALCKILIDEFYRRPRRLAAAELDAQIEAEADAIIAGRALDEEAAPAAV